MPRRDRTGPDGRGPMTGRGMGNCSISGIAKKVDSVVTPRGSGRRGGRRGR